MCGIATSVEQQSGPSPDLHRFAATQPVLQVAHVRRIRNAIAVGIDRLGRDEVQVVQRDPPVVVAITVAGQDRRSNANSGSDIQPPAPQLSLKARIERVDERSTRAKNRIDLALEISGQIERTIAAPAATSGAERLVPLATP